jgi:hypothetical protein
MIAEPDRHRWLFDFGFGIRLVSWRFLLTLVRVPDRFLVKPTRVGRVVGKAGAERLRDWSSLSSGGQTRWIRLS